MKIVQHFFIFIFLFFHTVVCFCDDLYTIENMDFIPPRYYVGDEVELKIKISIPEEVDVMVPEKKPATDWIEITRVQILPFREAGERKIHDISIFFRSYKTGTQPIPRLELGNIELANLEIHTLSVLKKNKEVSLSPSRGQLNLPDTWIKLVLLVLIVILIPIALFILLKYVLYRLIKSGNIFRIVMPHHALLRGLKKLKKQMKNMDFRSFYIRLSDIFKNYLQKRLAIPALTSTTREISLFARNNVLEKELSNEILQILSLSDFVKFGGRTSSIDEMSEVIRKIIFIVHCIEEEKKSVEP